MSNYTDLLIRSLLAFAVLWVFVSILHNIRLDKATSHLRRVIADRESIIRSHEQVISNLVKENDKLAVALKKAQNK